MQKYEVMFKNENGNWQKSNLGQFDTRPQAEAAERNWNEGYRSTHGKYAYTFIASVATGLPGTAPVPWTVEEPNGLPGIQYAIKDADGSYLAFFPSRVDDKRTATATTALPELLEVAKFAKALMLEFEAEKGTELDPDGQERFLFDLARAAIHKAEGGAS